MDDLVTWSEEKAVLKKSLSLILLKDQSFARFEKGIFPIGEKRPTQTHEECHANTEAQFVGLICLHYFPFRLACIIHRIEKLAKNFRSRIHSNRLLQNLCANLCPLSREASDRLVKFPLWVGRIPVREARHTSPSTDECLDFCCRWKSQVCLFTHYY